MHWNTKIEAKYRVALVDKFIMEQVKLSPTTNQQQSALKCHFFHLRRRRQSIPTCAFQSFFHRPSIWWCKTAWVAWPAHEKKFPDRSSVVVAHKHKHAPTIFYIYSICAFTQCHSPEFIPRDKIMSARGGAEKFICTYKRHMLRFI